MTAINPSTIPLGSHATDAIHGQAVRDSFVDPELAKEKLAKGDFAPAPPPGSRGPAARHQQRKHDEGVVRMLRSLDSNALTQLLPTYTSAILRPGACR